MGHWLQPLDFVPKIIVNDQRQNIAAHYHSSS